MSTDYFLKLDPKVEGESTDSKHKGEIEIESFSFGVTNQGTGGSGGGSGAGKSTAQDLHVTKKLDKASPVLMQACASGKHFPSAILTVRKAGTEQQEYLVFTLNDVYISSYQTGGSGGNVVPLDQFSLNYVKMVQEYKEQKADGTLGGSVKMGYDWGKNVKL